jgi:hypothetical protein
MTSPITITAAIDSTMDALTEPQQSVTATKTAASFAETLSAVPLFSSWTPGNPPYPAVTSSSGNGISTAAATNRRQDGRRRSSH